MKTLLNREFSWLGQSRPMGAKAYRAGSWGKDKVRRVNFGVFPTSHFLPRDQRRAPTDLLWCKKRYVTHGGLQLTFFGAKNTTWPTGVPNWPFRCLDIDINMLLFQTKYLPPPHCNCHYYHCHCHCNRHRHRHCHRQYDQYDKYDHPKACNDRCGYWSKWLLPFSTRNETEPRWVLTYWFPHHQITINNQRFWKWEWWKYVKMWK